MTDIMNSADVRIMELRIERNTAREELRRALAERDKALEQLAHCYGTQKALGIAARFGGIDGAHHKAWVIDQMVRALTGDGYDEFVRNACDGEDGPETYSWDTGVAP